MSKSAWTEKDQIDNFLKERRLMRSLENIIGGRLYEEHQSDTKVITMKMEILLESTSNKLMVGDLCNSIRIKLVTTGKKRWYDSIRIKLVPEHVEFDESNTNVLERFYTSTGNPVKEILLKLNLPDHRSILTELKVTPTKHKRMTKPDSSPRFIANYFNAGYLKMEVKVPDSS
ncbi:hypothetical protein Tco_1120152 [Tanacetum coccineum]